MSTAQKDPMSSVATWSGASSLKESGVRGLRDDARNRGSGHGEGSLPVVSSWTQAWQYIDDEKMVPGTKVNVARANLCEVLTMMIISVVDDIGPSPSPARQGPDPLCDRRLALDPRPPQPRATMALRHAPG